MGVQLVSRTARIITVAALLTLVTSEAAQSAGPGPLQSGPCPRYAISPKFERRTFSFAGEIIPLDRPDVARRVRSQVNFLLMDARSVLLRWLTDRARHGWLFEEILKKKGLPREFSLLAPILSSLSTKAPSSVGGAGWWALDKPCGAAEAVLMVQNAYFDDRMDVELSTKCFASRLKRIKADLNCDGWLMPTAAHVSTLKTVSETAENWNSKKFWDLPLPETAESVVTRWVALAVIDGDRAFYGIRPDNPGALTYDQVTGLLLAKNLAVAQIARFTGTSPKRVLELNPRIKPSKGELPAVLDGKRIPHNLAVPKGKGASLVAELTKAGYLLEAKGR